VTATVAVALAGVASSKLDCIETVAVSEPLTAFETETLAAIVVSITSWVVTGFIGSQGRVEVVTRTRVIDLDRRGDGRYG